eukprot:3431783-Amphidinium_carterae.2
MSRIRSSCTPCEPTCEECLRGVRTAQRRKGQEAMTFLMPSGCTNRPPPLNSLSSVPAVGQPGVLGRAENGV